MVRMEGLEPTRLSAPEPKSGASTNSATFATIHLQQQKTISNSLAQTLEQTKKNAPEFDCNILGRIMTRKSTSTKPRNSI